MISYFTENNFDYFLRAYVLDINEKPKQYLLKDFKFCGKGTNVTQNSTKEQGFDGFSQRCQIF